ncbi:MAG: hypothetical protein JSW47_17180 [Phycisphaerales bacterium]|nr:MAG: hypothetical protein JSW47_17180 [Phycisphaerales bacterium]
MVIKAQVPRAEVTQYNSQLKSVTSGRGSYSMALSHYELVPSTSSRQSSPSAQRRKKPIRGHPS